MPMRTLRYGAWQKELVAESENPLRALHNPQSCVSSYVHAEKGISLVRVAVRREATGSPSISGLNGSDIGVTATPADDVPCSNDPYFSHLYAQTPSVI